MTKRIRRNQILRILFVDQIRIKSGVLLLPADTVLVCEEVHQHEEEGRIFLARFVYVGSG